MPQLLSISPKNELNFILSQHSYTPQCEYIEWFKNMLKWLISLFLQNPNFIQSFIWKVPYIKTSVTGVNKSYE